MVPREPRSLPEWIEQAYGILAARIADSDEGLSRRRAQEVLVGHENFPNETTDAVHAIDRLLNTGWLYEVHDELRVTDPES